MDMEANEGTARNAVICGSRVPIPATPYLSFPPSDAPQVRACPRAFTSTARAVSKLSLPYYWNIAPDQDATIAPLVSTRRGLGLDLEAPLPEPRVTGTPICSGCRTTRWRAARPGMVDRSTRAACMGESPADRFTTSSCRVL